MIYAQLSPESAFFDIYPAGRVPLLSSIATMCACGDAAPQACYMVDVQDLSAAVFEKLVQRLHVLRGGDEVEIVAELAHRGLPVRVSQTTGIIATETVDNPRSRGSRA